MTTIELNARKAELIQAILNDINSEVVVKELGRVITKLTSFEPCRYTEQEIISSASESIQQRKEGRYTSHEDMKSFTL